MARKMTAQTLTNEQIKQIAREFNRTKGAKEFGEEFGVSRQRIWQVASNLRKQGVKIPKVRARKYATILTELREESPELFEGGDN